MVMAGSRRFPRERVRAFWRARLAGVSVADAAALVGVSETRARSWIAESGGMIPDLAEPSGWHLSLAEREEIAEGWAAGLSKSEIARGLGRYRCTIGTAHPRRRAQAQPGPAQPETGTAAGRAAVAPRARTGHQPRPEPAPARAAALPRVGGPRQGRAAGPAVETDQTGEQSGAARRGRDPAPRALEPGTDQPDTGTRTTTQTHAWDSPAEVLTRLLSRPGTTGVAITP